ncbi:MAG: hypothetical protein RBR97_11010 [Bacteroidales bacterium]|jgi:tetratricopeptide (TPR) repeat protein|nr:hypothetical protein [Bacteroidales bacterium]
MKTLPISTSIILLIFIIFVGCRATIEDNIKKGDEMISKSKIEKALFYYNKALEIDSTASIVYSKIGNIHLNNNDTAQALNYFLIAYNQKLNDYYLHYKIGNIYKSKKDTLNAIKHYTKAIEINDKKSEVYVERGILNYYTKNYELSLNDFNQAITLDKTKLLVIVDEEKGIPKNIRGEEKVKEILYPYIIPYAYRAKIKEINKDYYGAISDADFILTCIPDYGSIYFVRGNIYLILGNTKKACEDWSKANDYGIKDGLKNIQSYCNSINN